MTVEERKEAVTALVEAVKKMPTREAKITLWDMAIPPEERAQDCALEVLFHFTTNEEFAGNLQNYVYERCQEEA
jgi:hypothetical protein